MWIEREISNKITRLMREFPAVVVTGARQVGKTSLLRHLVPKYSYVTLDIPSTADLAENNPDLFLERYPPPVLIDEIQYAPKLFRHLKKWIDENRSSKGQIVMTGSQKFVLMKEVSDSLAGRVGFVELEPLSLFELGFDRKVGGNSLRQLIIRGGYPELWKEPDRDERPYFQAYLNTYVERDVRQIINVGNLLDFEKFIRICASRCGQIAVKSEIAKDVGVTVNTVQSWLSILETSNQIIFLQPYFENFGKRLVKTPKLYFADTGLLTYLLGLDWESLVSSAMVGPVWENFVFVELRKRLLSSNSGGQFWYYRDQLAREVDLLFVNKGRVEFIESKWSQQPEEKIAKKLESIAKDLKSRTVKRGSCSIIARNPDPMKISEETSAFSIFDFKLPL